jgi:hypothetical protein
MNVPSPAAALAVLFITGVVATPVLAASNLDWLKGMNAKIVWQVGRFDGKPAEFGLAPDKAQQFAARYGNGVTYVVGKSDVADFPFIQPSEKDTAWGAKPEVPFSIRFSLDSIKPEGYVLIVGLTDTHEQFASRMVVAVNGENVWEQVMALGRGRAFYGDFNGAPRTFVIPAPSARLHPAENEITLTLRGGSWVAYDAVALVWLGSRPLEPPKAPALSGDYANVKPEAFRAEGGIVLAAPDGVETILFPNGALNLNLEPAWESAFQLDLFVRTLSGSWTLDYALPDGGRGPLWRVRFETDANGARITMEDTPLSRGNGAAADVPQGWLHVTILDDGKMDQYVNANVEAESGAKFQGKAMRLPEPGKLCWRAGAAGARVQVAHARLGATPVFGHTGLGGEAHYEPEKTVQPRPSMEQNPVNRIVYLRNGRLQLCIRTHDGLNPCELRDLQGMLYANADYVWPGNELPKLIGIGEPLMKQEADGACSVRLTGKLGALTIVQTFVAPADKPNTLTETICLRNDTSQSVEARDFACGFAKKVLDHNGWIPSAQKVRFHAVPYKVHTETGERCEYGVEDLLVKKNWFSVDFSSKRVDTPVWGSEAWGWSAENTTLLVTKYNPDAMEWSLIEPVWRWDRRDPTNVTASSLALRFGGAGHWKLGHPEKAARLEPGASFTFGTTEYQLIEGGWKDAFCAFRRSMEQRGHVVPANYNPPVHWNELYDNLFWWAGDSAANRAKLYKREDMEAEAAKAHELGCEALYLDPGWDTSMASCIWAADRLGPEEDFVKCLREKYGLKLALHTPLAAWSDIRAYPVEARVKTKDGKTLDALCSAAPAYLDTKAERLIELCKKGACFVMFDGSWFTGECWDPAHGHPLPLTRQDQLDAYLKLNQRLHQAAPDVLIEQHDPCVGGTTVRYAPTYILHGKPGSFDELWGYEYMWDPMADILSGRALSLYYVNLAYSIPIYLHIDLRKDNPQTIEFWWYASTCRHLGVGGKHPDPKVWEAHKKAMREYLRLKPFYTQGIFYGIEETVHAHTLPGRNACVINVFNLSDQEIDREIPFRLSDVGLSKPDVAIEGAASRISGEDVTLSVHIPAKGHRLIEIRPR